LIVKRKENCKRKKIADVGLQTRPGGREDENLKRGRGGWKVGGALSRKNGGKLWAAHKRMSLDFYQYLHGGRAPRRL